ncbi:MAG TPA: Na+:solute symporter [Candidatus Marinimicrobia bacterium]|nr:Na+:solute symporter [Candidatus Neomarinimicrobiota bacterium]HRS51045.1 Na+:solute symporter [Candidatus Neomarinimicrobiota bacterium]HRU92552.1 Na+:solute symporter [Candidatus Neomarinimicrobiota bacterium]
MGITPKIGSLDWAVVVIYFLLIFGIAIYYYRRAGENTSEFFLSGRNLPWWLAGTAMVATTFAADTPLAVTELVAKNGIAGNWLWWNLAIGAMLTVFFFARLWRRAGIMTDVEFTEMRYSGKAAAVLRGFRALYLGIFMNTIVMGWVHKAMEKIFHVAVPGIDPFLLVAIVAGIIAIYASLSGLLGTARTDSFQFLFAMTGCIILAVIVIRLPQVGGAVKMKAQLAPQVLDFFPKVGRISGPGITGGVLSLSLGAFIAHIGLQWWSSWYPGAEPGGGGYIAQRMMSAKDEKHSLFATLWFTIAHYTLRPWPWIIVALAALVIMPRASSTDLLRQENPVLYNQVVEAYKNPNLMKSDPIASTPEFQNFYEKYENTIDPGVMYPKMMLRYLPTGILGLLIATFLAAYMSTISSQLNWGTSYIINDFYRRFIRKKASEKHYVLVSRIAILLMIIFSLFVTKYFLTTISGAWEFIINASAGMGAVLILRWFWWRINAWSEIAAMIAPLIIYPIARYKFGLQSPITLYPVVLGTTIIWLLVTFLTKPEKDATLTTFYRKVHPGGIGWKRIVEQIPDVRGDSGFGRTFICWILGVVLVYASLFGIGKIIFHEYFMAGVYFILVGISVWVIYYNLNKMGWKSLKE